MRIWFIFLLQPKVLLWSNVFQRYELYPLKEQQNVAHLSNDKNNVSNNDLFYTNIELRGIM